MTFTQTCKLAVSLFTLSTLAAQGSKAAQREISDSLVRGLSCQSLSVNSIYKAIREDAFSDSRNMPITNWTFQHGLFPLGNCWALSSTQRMFSYLARYNESNTISNEQRIITVLDMIRRSIPVLMIEKNGNRKSMNREIETLSSRRLNTYRVFQVEGDSLDRSYDFWWGLRAGYEMSLSRRKTVVRNFRNDIQTNQVSHFYRAGNVGMGIGSGATSARENSSSVRTLTRNLDGKRLTLVNLRMNRTAQHVVMVKSYSKHSNGQIVFKVYDSNQPSRDQDLIYDSRSGAFIAPQIATPVIGYTDGAKTLGVFIVDEDERAPFEAAMLTHYRNRCR